MSNSVEAKDQQGQVLSVLFDTSPPYFTAKQMSELADWADQALADGQHHPLLVSGHKRRRARSLRRLMCRFLASPGCLTS